MRLWTVGLLMWMVGWNLSQANLLQKDGVLVFEDEQARVISGVWTVLVVLQAPTSPNLTLLQVSARQQWNSIAEHLTEADRVIWTMRMQQIQAQLTLGDFEVRGEEISRSTRRQRRGLIDFIGRVGKTLFGLSTEQDVNKLATAVDLLRHQGEELVEDNDAMMTIINTTRTFVRQNRDDIEHLQNRSDELAGLIQHLQIKMAHHVQAIRVMQVRRIVDQSFMIMELLVKGYITSASHFNQQRMQLERGYLTREILPVHCLEAILTKMSSKGHVALASHWYYQFLRIQPMWESAQGELAFKVIVPAVALEQFLTYQIQYYPVLLTSNLTRTINGHDRVALSTETGVSFIPDSDNCAGGSPLICYPAVHNRKAQCESHLILGQEPSMCNVTVSRRPVYKSLVFRSRADVTKVTVDAFEKCTIITRCPGQTPTKRPVVGIERVDLNPLCVLEAVDWKVKGIEIGSSKINIRPREPLHLPALNYTWPKEVLPEMHYELALHHHINIPVVQFHKWHYHGRELGWMHTLPYETMSSTNSVMGMVIIIIGLVMIIGGRFYLRKVYVRRSEVAMKSPRMVPQIYVKAKTLAPGLNIRARALNDISPPVSLGSRAAAMGGGRHSEDEDDNV